MTSTTSGSPAPAAPTPPTFSYAQAAKGRASATAASAMQASSGISTPAKDTTSAINTPSASVNGAATSSEAGDKSVSGSFEAVNKSDPLGLGMESESKSATLVNSGSSPASPSFGTASTSTLPKEEDLTLATSATYESTWDRNTQPPNGLEKPNEATEGRRSKKGKKQKNAEKEAEKEKEEEKKQELLVAAPPPAVNIWQQRREAQALKVKPSPTILQSPQTFTETTLVNDSTSKSNDLKRRGKATGDDVDKSSSIPQAGGVKESSNSTRGQKKGSDNMLKIKDDAPSKRVSSRGSRVVDKEEKAAISQLPPPVEDAISWPTPETALEEEKRKAQEKEKVEKEKDERDEPTYNKPRPKEKWVAVPYVPSVNFNTPLPTRGGRGRGGARGGRDSAGRSSHGGNGGPVTERTGNSSATVTSPAGESENRGRGGSSAARATSLPPNSSKRPSSDTRAQGKSVAAGFTEKSKPGQSNVSSKPETGSQVEVHRSSTTTQQNQHLEGQQTTRGENMKAQGPPNENGPRANADRRSEPNARGLDQFKEGANTGKDGSQVRAEGRGDRGRGGFRGRGGHSAFPNGQQQQPQHQFTNGHGAQPPNGFLARQNSNPYSPSMQQAPFGNQYVPNASRGGRGGSRSQSIPNNALYGRFPGNIAQMAPLQTPNQVYEYQQPSQTMSAVPYGSYVDHFSVLAMVTMQLEYYFSIDNLCKDVFLRKHMDSQGFVFLTFIAGFKRIQALTHEVDLLRYACHEAPTIDIIKGEDGYDRLRRKEGWEKWVLAMDERDETVRNDGPSTHHRQEPLQRSQQPQHMGPTMIQGAMSPPAFSPNGTEARFQPYGNGSPVVPNMNGNGTAYHHQETPLSAAVPDFNPGFPLNGRPLDPLEQETTFNDEDVANLKLVFASPKGQGESKSRTPFHNASSRTFSNGSIDGRSIAEEIHDDARQGRGLPNGSRVSETSPDSLRRSRSPFTPLSPSRTVENNGPPVMWKKGQRQQAPIPKDNIDDELYTSVRARALKNRDATALGETHSDMKMLYEFWSHFLCRNFNPTMYSEFRNYAIEDAKQNATVGMEALVDYYNETLKSKNKVIPDVLARHYIELVKFEKQTMPKNDGRPAFVKLRAAWRDGALDMKSRKKIDNLVNSELREELER